MVRYIILLTLLFLGSSTLFAQTTGSLQGKVIDVGNDEGLPFANVVLEKDGVQVSGTQTDFDGNYNFSNVSAGTFDVLVSYVGFPTIKTEGVVIKLGQVVRFDIEMEEGADFEITDSTGQKQEIIVRGYRIPLIEQDATSGGQTLGAEDIKNLATRNISSIAATTAGVNQTDEGEATNSNGSRSTSNDTYIDGVRVIGNFGIPETEIDQVQIITSGIPAEFGDATGSITNIITKGPSSELSGGVQLETSQFLDAFAANRADAYFSGPIIAKPMLNSLGDTLKKDGKVRKSTILGYRFAGVYSTSLDSRPSALGSFKLKEDKLNEILANPLVANPSGSGRVYSADFITQDDLEVTQVRPNARESYAVANAKIDFKPNNDFYFVAGGQAQFGWGNTASTANRLFNYQNNSTYKGNTWRVSARFRHTVSSTQPGGDSEDSDSSTIQSAFQNFSYELQGDYSQENSSNEDPRYKDRLWEYGYVGKFYQSRNPVIGAVDSVFVTNTIGDTIGVNVEDGHLAFNNSFDRYEPNTDINPGLASYNNLILQPNNFGSPDFDPNNFDSNAPTTIDQMEIINGLQTGARTSVYGLFNAPHQLGGSAGPAYGKSSGSQVRANVKANFDLVMAQRSGSPIRHSIQLGGTFEQRINRAYSISPFSLWNLASQTTNNHISNATDPTRLTGETFYDPFRQRQYNLYEALIRTDEEGKEVEQSLFAQRLREELGLNKRDWVNVHELTPDQMNLDWFEASTLITGRSRVLNYYGYDYLGNPTGADIDFFSFFTETETLADGREIKTRPIAPSKPIYAAGYVQDKFTYKDIICNVGVRFDSYDANTKVLNDPYSIAGYETAAEFESTQSLYAAGQGVTYNRPDNIDDDFAVYVNDNNKDAVVVGYRSGEEWYNAEGNPVNNPSELGSTIVPALKGFGTSQIDPQGENYDPTQAFRDYTPSLIVMPRIAFSFPISKEANFYANYDVLSQRPPSGAFASPYTYYNFREIIASTTNSRILGNPDLKPQRTINYEVGFQQKLTDFSKFKVSLLYREERDLIQVREYINAYPSTYSTYGNSDFSTTKAFKLEYDMRENNNLRVLANYTLAFSEGTGSSPTSSTGVAAKELKYVFPLSFDQRHTFYVMFDYRFKSGDKYNGPKIGKFDVLENTGVNLAFNANSGRPYTRKEIPGGIGTSFSDRITDGSINGARMDWAFRVDLRFDRDFVIGKKSKNPIRLNVYLRIQNLLNTQNPLAVYSVTGSPTDDGFLTTAGSPGPGFAASQPDAYETLYDLRMNDPYNISRPRRIFLGLRFSF
ncbi:MAG: Outer membrane receptor for ferrienterochelin and colicins [uncultured Aureispira sp.]|uniref:Outer membrane receptor for ferrienterochelin and colicins n=1 Tax=uncultured Aureispira sp. TaxID=1331704 RepID=A0A6S6SKG8_9BACT|nr:MAG: Outer membrane receptor for ferrienterochelin and colicins [uncultured Aureispira sp.]